MSGMDNRFGVLVLYKGRPVEVIDNAVFLSWDDDNEDQLRVQFTIKMPEDY